MTLIFNQTVANLKDENDFLQDTEGYLNKQQTISDERSRMMQQLREHQVGLKKNQVDVKMEM